MVTMSNQKRALIIGAAGFVGAYLIEELLRETDWDLHVTKIPRESIENKDVSVHDLDIMDPQQVENILNETKPDFIFHLAAQSSVALSWKNPNLTVDINIKGTINFLETIKNSALRPRILLIGSGEEYGLVEQDEIPIKETNPLRPGNFYAITKATQNMIGKLYFQAYGLDILMVRAFNHIGPRQAELFVVSDFCKQVAQIEAGKQIPTINVGNLDAQRDFTDVRDVVRAYRLLINKGTSGELYNVGSGKALRISDILEKILSLSDKTIEVVQDPNKYRPIDIPIIVADITKIVRDVAWQPRIGLETTLVETLSYWRNLIS